MNVFTILYWAGLLIQIAVRVPLQKPRKTAAKTVRRVSPSEQVLFGLLTVGGIVLPLVYSVTAWLDFADYRPPGFLGWLGVVLLANALWIFIRAHLDLKTNWSPSLEIYVGHTLVTRGIFDRIRHPIYASQWVLAAAQILLIQNWVAGPAGLLVFIPFYLLRVPAEERMMLDVFGDQYREYMKRTGAVVPRIKK